MHGSGVGGHPVVRGVQRRRGKTEGNPGGRRGLSRDRKMSCRAGRCRLGVTCAASDPATTEKTRTEQRKVVLHSTTSVPIVRNREIRSSNTRFSNLIADLLFQTRDRRVSQQRPHSETH